MGQDIAPQRFVHRDFERFARHLRAETDALHDLVESGRVSAHAPMAGHELEARLVDAAGRPAACNDAFLARVDSADVVTELGRFQIELNVPPQPTAGDGLWRLHDSLLALWQRCQAVAREKLKEATTAVVSALVRT